MAESNQIPVEPKRIFGFFSTLAFSVGGIGLAYSSLVPLSALIGYWPSNRLVGILTVGALLAFALSYVYSAIGAAAPYAGADYVLASRVLGGGLAFVASWTFVVFGGLLAGWLIVTLLRELIPFGLQMLAILGNISGISNTAETLATPAAQATLGTALALLFFLLSLIPPRITAWLLRFGLILSLAGWTVLLFQLATPIQPFPAAWDQFMGANHYNEQLNLARSLNMAVTQNTAPVSAAGLLAALWVFFGGAAPVAFAGQVKSPGRNLILSSLVSLLLSWALICAGVILLQRLVPARWLAAESFLYLNPAYSGLAMPWLPFYAGVLHPVWALSLFVLIVLLFGMVNFIQVIYYACSRTVLAWAKDNLIPGIFKYEHPLMKTPVVSLFVVGVLAQLGVMDSSLGGRLGDRGTFVFVSAICTVVPVLAIVVFPAIRREWFKRSSLFSRAGIGPLPFASLVGVFVLIFLGVVFLSGWVAPILAGARIQALLALVLVAGVGWLWYALRKRYLKQQGENIADVFRAFPQE